MPSDVSVLQPPHHLELHSSANSVGQFGLRLTPSAPLLSVISSATGFRQIENPVTWARRGGKLRQNTAAVMALIVNGANAPPSAWLQEGD